MTQCPTKFWLVILMPEHVLAFLVLLGLCVAFDVTSVPCAGAEFTMGCLWLFRNSSFQFFF